MKIFLRLILISMLSFMYADEDCSLVTDQATCEADDHCVWDDTDGLCDDNGISECAITALGFIQIRKLFITFDRRSHCYCRYLRHA